LLRQPQQAAEKVAVERSVSQCLAQRKASLRL
jgi:hypothetical protein